MNKKYLKNENMKMTCSSGAHETIYHTSRPFLLFLKTQLQGLEI